MSLDIWTEESKPYKDSKKNEKRFADERLSGVFHRANKTYSHKTANGKGKIGKLFKRRK